jgi:DNA-binding winged helix-turn-helix (wHTH) protein/TolB-like protein/Tfp pilus assembly protein PilF
LKKGGRTDSFIPSRDSTNMEKPVAQVYEFDGFRLDARDLLLERGGEPVHVPRKALELLVLFVRHSGLVLDKETLFDALWPDTVVEEANLTQNVYVLRKALGARPDQTPYIETVPRRGYRFLADVCACERGPDAPASAPAPVAPVNGEGPPVVPPCEPPASVVGPRVRLRHALAVLLAVCALTAAVLLWLSARKGPRQAEPPIKSIAILPFRTVGGAGDDAHLGLGMTDTLITRLSALKQVSVRPTSAITKYTAATDPLAAGRELGVDAVMDGTVQREGNSVRVTARLVRMDSEQAVWAEKFDETFTNVFALQDRISEQVAAQLRLTLSGAQRQTLVKHPTTSAEAYQAYAEGLFFWNKRRPADMAKAIECFERAVARDPGYALAFAALSDAYYLAARFGFDFVPRAAAVEKARAAAARALALDDSLAESHLAAAMVLQFEAKDWPAVESHFRRAVELNPYHATVRQRYGWHLLSQRRLGEGVSEMRRARELDPVSPINNAALSSALIFARRYDEAISVSLRLLELDPGASGVRFNLALAYGHKGMYEESLAELKRVSEARPETNTALEALAITYAMAGQTAEAEAALRELCRLAKKKDGSVSGYNVALAYAALGRRDEAFAWLESTREEVAALSLYFMYDPHLDPLRADPRFEPFLKRYG